MCTLRVIRVVKSKLSLPNKTVPWVSVNNCTSVLVAQNYRVSIIRDICSFLYLRFLSKSAFVGRVKAAQGKLYEQEVFFWGRPLFKGTETRDKTHG